MPLTPPQQQILRERNEKIWRLYQEGISYGEIAKNIGLSLTGVASVVYKLRKEKESRGEQRH
jgi:DNA-binding CsgD family transcriptional regulator